jgi:predicted metal-binding membrane protein
MFVMSAVMMTAMMVPTAAPMILVYASLNRRRRDPQPFLASIAVFLLGYLVIWSGFAALATVAQWGLHIGALLSPMMVSTSPILGGALLRAAGVFQLSPIKYACLSNCRTPLGFLMTEWRDGPRGAIVMGFQHGLYCLGCCWVLDEPAVDSSPCWLRARGKGCAERSVGESNIRVGAHKMERLGGPGKA